MKVKFVKLMCLVIVSVQGVFAQDNSKPISEKEKKEVITIINQQLLDHYVDLDLAQSMVISLKNNLKTGVYKSLKSSEIFANKINEDLQNVCHDLHLKLRFEPKRIAQKKRSKSPTDSIKNIKRQIKAMQRSNFGFSEVKILEGNIGYLDVRYFADSKYTKETLEASLSFLSNSNAIIIDLRQNSGGVPSTLKLLSSYFFDTTVLLSEFYNRFKNTTEEFWTASEINGKTLANTELYILTSKHTFSAAEAFAYNLKHLKRATVIGERTRGGANRNKRFYINDNFSLSIPYIKSIHPITKTNWEGKGVMPTIETKANKALVTAYLKAIDTTIGNHPIKNRILNKMGYNFLQNGSPSKAIQIFEANTKLYPEDANVWDSLGEAYLKNNDKEKALIAYKKALQINSELASAKTMVEKLK